MSEVKRYGHIGYLVHATEQLQELYRDMKVYVLESDYDAAQSELSDLRRQLTQHAIAIREMNVTEAALREELARKDRVIEDMLESNCDMTTCLAAAEQRNAELTQALERGKLWLELFRAWFGDYGVSQEDHAAIIRTLRGLPHPPSEFDKPTESGASE